MDDDEQKVLRCRVAVVGAGASGLAAAQSLLPRLQGDGSVEPLVILEGRNRIGGRIHTLPLNADKQTRFLVDMGAAWVHGTGVAFGEDGKGENEELNPMVKILQKRKDLSKEMINEDPLKAGLLYTCPKGNQDTRPRDVLHSSNLLELYVGGNRIKRNSLDISAALDLYEKILSTASKVGTDAYNCGEGMSTTTISIGQTIDCIRSQASGRSGLKYQFGNNEEESNEVESLLGYYFHSLQDWHPHELSNIQLSEFIVEEQENDLGGDEGDYPGPHCNVRGGMATLLDPLLENGVKDCILCEHEVVRIERRQNNSSDTILIKCLNGTKMLADYCIVTISIGCLKAGVISDLFAPNLSDEKLEAISMLQMGSYRKVFLLFDKIFWPAETPFFGLVRASVQSPELWGTEDFYGLGNYLNVYSFARDGIACLEVTLGGKGARWISGRSDEDIREEVLSFLDDSMHVEDGSSFSDRCTGCHVTRWEEDRFSMGAYSGFKLGTLERHAESLGKSEWAGRLIFAGDAVIPEYEGSVHGALLSGEEAARNVMERIFCNAE